MNSRKNYNDINEVGINNYLRKIIDDKYTNRLTKASLLDYYGFLSILIKAIQSDKKEDIVLSNSLCSILYLDTYKMLSYSIKRNLASENEIANYSYLLNIENINDVKELYKENIGALFDSIDYCSVFMNLPSIAKVNVVNSLTSQENYNLNSISLLHQNDLANYNIKIDKDYLYNFFTNCASYYLNTYEIPNVNPVIIMIINSIRDNYFINPLETKELISSITKDVFDNIEEFNKSVPSSITVFDDLAIKYQEDENKFNNNCLFNQDIMELVFGTYFVMRDNKMIRNKIYDR